MNVVITVTLTIYTMGLTALAYLYSYGDPGTLGGFIPFAYMMLAVPLSAGLSYYLGRTA